ncbi:MAG: ATP-binding cassette domain-containing protein [Kiritimatiellae bacterium]|nr:ATP-binding cassette domain-containing protein [Kiritimatiellia bacterium]
MSTVLLELKNVKTHFTLSKGVVKAVDGVDLKLRQGEILGLVGESGCGKSTLARTILQLTPSTKGSVKFAGKSLGNLTSKQLRKTRTDFQMIFQDPYASLNPRMTIFDTIAEPVQCHKRVSKQTLTNRTLELMNKVGLDPRTIKKYPHEFSGGQRQRIAIARALASEPKLIIADEPVSALDVSIQAQILNLLSKLCKDMGLTMIFISHDLSVVKHIADRIAVMYLGKIVEIGEASEIFEQPRHAYTKILLNAILTPPDIALSEYRVPFS